MTQPQPQQRVTIDQAMDLAGSYHRAGRFREAETIYRQVLAVEPQHPDALHQLGLIALGFGQLPLAKDLIERAIAVNPSEPNYRSNLGKLLTESGQNERAVAECQRAIQLAPQLPEAFNNLGNALLALGKADEAGEALRTAVSLRPSFAHAWSNLGIVLQKQEKIEEAMQTYRRAASLEPRLAVAQSNLGNLLRLQGRLDEAIATLENAKQLDPNYATVHTNLGSALHAIGRLDEAIAAFERAIAIKPALAVAHYNLGMALILKGDFARGWQEHEWRIQADSKIGRSVHGRSEPQWDGSDLTGKRILVHAEQGLGDTIQFARYLPRLARRGARVILQCDRSLMRLMGSIEGIERVIADEDQLPDFDIHAPLLSLPLRFGTTIESIPAEVPYIKADPAISQAWRDRLGAPDGTYRIGLTWAGNPRHENDRNRSIKLTALAPLTEIPGIRFVNLQKREDNGVVPEKPPGMTLVDFGATLDDFTASAGLIDNLDLVITVDTAIAHLAGAMGKPTWVLLPFVPDWRWMLDREDSPWYPTMRLFRQPRIGDWEAPIRRICDALRER